MNAVSPGTDSGTTLQAKRLHELIDFCHEVEKLRSPIVSHIAQHRDFSLYENEMADIPGVDLHPPETDSESESENEIWFSVKRLMETQAPKIKNAWLHPWLRFARGPNNPYESPTLRQEITGADLIKAGTHISEQRGIFEAIENGKPCVAREATISLQEYEQAPTVHELYRKYIESEWTPWSTEEKKRRKTIELYGKLDALRDQIEGKVGDAQIELVWGLGIGVWKKIEISEVKYPVISQLVELSQDQETGTMEIRPRRNIAPRIELDWYARQNNSGANKLQKFAKEHFDETIFSPFDPSTYQSVLRRAVVNLDVKGVYWPDQTQPDDRTLPKADDGLKITDTWVLFVRPKTSNAYFQDLEKFKTALQSYEKIPPAVAAIVTDPATKNPEIKLPAFRGISATYHDTHFSREAKELYFPKPFNDEQIQIIRLLECHNGVVVQGPPGTGKTHTIANVICHFLANGKRVLVTSTKHVALQVLQHQLPDEIRPLAIPRLTSDREQEKELENAIRKIASEIHSLEHHSTAQDILDLEKSIDEHHGKLAKIDHDIWNWAQVNLSEISIDSDKLQPQDAARELADNRGGYEHIPDPIDVTSEFAPRFNDQDITDLRAARMELGKDIIYLESSLPLLDELPVLESVLQTHQDLLQLERLNKEFEIGDIPDLADASQETMQATENLAEHVAKLKEIRSTLDGYDYLWIPSTKKQLNNPSKKDAIQFLHGLGETLKNCHDIGKKFLSKPVEISFDLESEPYLTEAITNLSQGKIPFGWRGILGKRAEKRHIKSIKILGKVPQGMQEWQHVKEYVTLQGNHKQLAIQWNAIAEALNLPIVENSPQGGEQAFEWFQIFADIETAIRLEIDVLSQTKEVFPSWMGADSIIADGDAFTKLDRTLHHHRAKNRLAKTIIQKEHMQRQLDGKQGPIVDDIKHLLHRMLGDPSIADTDMREEYTRFTKELSRILALRSKLNTVERVAKLVEESGAPEYARQLREPMTAAVDRLLPSNWKQTWKHKRIDTYLEKIDGQKKLQHLSQQRQNIQYDLAGLYEKMVSRKTWLQLATNASPKNKTALQAYLKAIQNLGKGRGKRAVSLRKAAREAAKDAIPVVPCWIMPHDRISEELPAEFACFDLVIIDEASQSDLKAFTALLRAKKALIVGDDKQVSPEAVGLEEKKIQNLIERHLPSQVKTFKQLMSPVRSIYDLWETAHVSSSVMLREHFRCAAPIIEYSKREFYNHELQPLRLPKASERFDPPLVDILVRDGYRKPDEDTNLSEAKVIVAEVKKIISDEQFHNRSIGVVSLLSGRLQTRNQAYLIWEMLKREIDHESMKSHKIECGDARTFQGKERDIIFLSMVVTPDQISTLSAKMYEQRFNVAASRARDRVYLVRSVELEQLGPKDALRRNLIEHFSQPFRQDEVRQGKFRELCESDFEREMYDALTERGYRVTPQVKVGAFRIDMIVEGDNDTRLAIECDGDTYHGPENWLKDMNRQRILERAGWTFWRCFASKWYHRRSETLENLVNTLNEHDVRPLGAESAPRSNHCEHRVVTASELDQPEESDLEESPDEVIEEGNLPPSQNAQEATDGRMENP